MTSHGTYTISYPIAEFSDNFADVVPRTQRLPGLDGGWNSDGDLPSPTQVGKVTLGFTITTDTREEMDAKRDEISQLTTFGLQKLVYTPLDYPTSPERFCYARVNHINMPERKDLHTDLWQKVTITFQVPDPHWYVADNVSWSLGDGTELGDVGVTIGSGAVTTAASGTSTEQTITHDGTDFAIAKVSVIPGTGNSCQNVRVQRIFNGAVADEIRYTGTLSDNDELFVDGGRQLALLNGVSVFGSQFSYIHPDFLRLYLGANTIRVLFDNVGDQATVRIWFHDTYR